MTESDQVPDPLPRLMSFYDWLYVALLACAGGVLGGGMTWWLAVRGLGQAVAQIEL